MRLTRRGRVVVLLTALLLAFAVGVLVAATSVATQEPGTPAPTKVMTVGTGDTLWDIAADLTPAGGDVRETMRGDRGAQRPRLRHARRRPAPGRTCPVS